MRQRGFDFKIHSRPVAKTKNIIIVNGTYGNQSLVDMTLNVFEKSMALPQFSFIDKIATPMPEMDPPAINPEESKTPGEVSASVAVLFFLEVLSTSHRIIPPKKIGVEDDRGR